jgi:hypothetical protein
MTLLDTGPLAAILDRREELYDDNYNWPLTTIKIDHPIR